MAYKRISPMPIIEGGTNATSFGTTDGTVIFNGTSLVTIATGTAGQILTSAGAGVAPSFQTGAGATISITGDSGGALTSGSFTFTGGTTGLSFGGSGSTETLTFAGITANGGTVSLATDATTSTINVGTGAGAKTSTFGSASSTSTTTVQSGSGVLNITSTGGALTINSGVGALGISTDASATTVSLATGGAVKTVTLGSTNSTSVTTVACGTGGANFGTSANAHATVIGSTTASATTTIQAPSAGVILTGVQGVAVANKNYVTINTSTGAIGSDAGAASSISITGDTGGALTGAAFTFAGGTTGLSFGGSGSTETLTFAGITANGGTVSLATDATTSTINVGTGAGVKTTTLGSTNTTSSTIIKSGSGNVVVNSGLTVDSTGRTTNSVQPAVYAWASTVASVTGDGTVYTILFNNVIFDQNSNFNSTTSIFTAPKTGIYYFSVQAEMVGLLVAHTQSFFTLVCTSRSPIFCLMNPFPITGSGGLLGISFSTFIDMSANDTAKVTIRVSNGTKVVGLDGNSSSDVRTSLSIFLVA